MRRLPRAAVAAPVLVVLAAAPGPVTAQVDPSPPDTVAHEYLRGFQAAAWEGLAQRLHPAALEYLRLAIDIQLDADTTGWALANLGNAGTRAEYDARGDARVFADVMVWTQDNAQGLLSSLVSREAELVGLVMEGADTAHAVYRVTTIAYGAEPAVQVATLLRTDAGWKVREAPEIRTLHTALRAVPVPRGGSGSAPGAAAPPYEDEPIPPGGARRTPRIVR